MASLSISNTLPAIADKDLEFDKYANFLGALVARAAQWEYVGAKPIELTIDITTTCNLKCPYCATGSGRLMRPTSSLKPELHSQILAFCGRQAFIHWYFSNGEPLLNKALPSLMKAASDYGIFSVISTNLSVPVGRDRLRDLVQSGIGVISCSIDGACANTYSQYRVGGNFNLVMDNLAQLIELKKECGVAFPLIEWRFLLFEHNQHEIKDVLAIGKKMGVDLVEIFFGNAPPSPPLGQVRRSTIQHLPVDPVHGAYWDKVKGRRDTPLRKFLGRHTVSDGVPSVSAKPTAKCDWLYLGGMYYPDGKVGPCCVVGDTSTDFGDHNAHSYPAIWNNDHYQSARSSFSNADAAGRVPTICEKCPLPEAQNNMFRDTLRAYLLNAPDWFLKIVGADPAAFFHPFDYRFLGKEIRTIADYAKQAPSLAADIPQKLEKSFADRPRIRMSIVSAIDKTS